MRRGKILRVRYGLNPNSSSISADLSFLLIGATSLAVLINLGDVALRVWFARRRKKEPETT